MTVAEILAIIEDLAPPHYAASFDRIGLQVGDPNAEVERIAVTLDSGLGAINFARKVDAQLLVAHHPVIWEPLEAVRTDRHAAHRVAALLQAGIACIAAHTNWDCAEGGINDALAARLGLRDVATFGASEPTQELKMVVFVPHADAERVIDAAAEAGAGIVGTYRRCVFMNPGQGSFEPQPGANPTIGEVGQRETVEEVRLEMVCPARLRHRVAEAVREAHPYEEPGMDFVRLVDGNAKPAGRIGTIDATSLEGFVAQVDSALGTRSLAWGSGEVRRVAVVGGAAAHEWRAAQSAGADVFVTGEVPQHMALEAAEVGFKIVCAGHYATEQPGMAVMRDRLAERTGLEVKLFVPPAGESGRPLG